ncbi:NAD(P)H-quinone oxidoreductase subunit S [Wolffia australiana]
MASTVLLPGLPWPKSQLSRRPGRAQTGRISAKLRLSEILGGRGLCNGEAGLKQFLADPPAPPPKPTAAPPAPAAAPPPALGEGAFEKELQGLTGGFPGGEKGLKKFITENPPPAKAAAAAAPAAGGRRAAPELPLLMPGMIVIVRNERNPFYMYCGTVQRVTDGMAAVLFEGGNWDKLLSFRLDELERRERGPPMVNPKSAVLEVVKDNQS